MTTIASVVQQVRSSLVGREPDIVVVDDHSTDDTREVAQGAGASVLPMIDGGGLAASFRAGVSAAISSGAEVIVHIDADGQYDAADLPRLIAVHRSRGGLVVGNRLWCRPVGMSDFRYRWNKHLSELVTAVTATQIDDAQSGLRVFGRDVADAVPINSRFTYTQEQIVRAAFAGFRISQPQIFFGPRHAGRSRLMRTPVHYLAEVFGDLDRLLLELGVDLESAALFDGRPLGEVIEGRQSGADKSKGQLQAGPPQARLDPSSQ
jgi:glycosyltransferase involved in cell wall biosynthesis